MLVALSLVDAAALGELGHMSLSLCTRSPVTACVIFVVSLADKRYAASVTATVNSGSSHSSGRREHIGKDILRQGVLLVATPVAVLAEPALEHTHSGTHLRRSC